MAMDRRNIRQGEKSIRKDPLGLSIPMKKRP